MYVWACGLRPLPWYGLFTRRRSDSRDERHENIRIYDTRGVLHHLLPIHNPSDGYWLNSEDTVVGTTEGLWCVITHCDTC